MADQSATTIGHHYDSRLRTPAEMVAELRALSGHLRGLDSASPEGDLMRDAANYIAGAAASLREHMAMLRKYRDALRIVAGEAQPADNLLGNADIARIALHGR